MKMKLANAKNFAAIKRNITNVLSGEKAQGLADELRALIDELETAEVEYDEAAFAEEVRAAIEKYNADEKSEVPAAVAEMIAKKVAAIQNSMSTKKEGLSVKVKNAICAAVLRANDKMSVENSVNKVLVENGISGLSFSDVIDYTIVENWGDYNPLFAQFKKVPYTKFFYNTDDLEDAGILAKQWDKTSTDAKAIQSLSVTGKSITTHYIYKRQQIAQEDLDEIERAGEASNFLRWINEELDRQIVNTIILQVLIGDTVNASGKRVTSFEKIGKAVGSGDVFTTVSQAAATGVGTKAELYTLCNAVKNPYGKKKVLVLSNALFAAVCQFVYGSGGTTEYRSVDDVAKELGVDEIIKSDILGGTSTSDKIEAICLLPDGYWWNEKNAIAVSYPQYEMNALNYQKERNCGGAIHDLYSTAVLWGKYN